MAARVETQTDCAVCGQRFTHIASRANKAKYCSRKCYHKAMRLKGTVDVECAHCGTAFKASPSQNRKYCSRRCINKEKQAIWSPTFATVRKAMAVRGMITSCEICGYDAEPRILGVHHKDHNRRNNSLSNLIVVCPNCHSLEHLKHTPHGCKV